MSIVIATTRQNGTCSLLTSAKLSVGYLVVGITMSRSLTVDLTFISHFHFLFYFSFHFFYFSIFRTDWVRGYQSCCHISHKVMAQSQD